MKLLKWFNEFSKEGTEKRHV